MKKTIFVDSRLNVIVSDTATKDETPARINGNLCFFKEVPLMVRCELFTENPYNQWVKGHKVEITSIPCLGCGALISGNGSQEPRLCGLCYNGGFRLFEDGTIDRGLVEPINTDHLQRVEMYQRYISLKKRLGL